MFGSFVHAELYKVLNAVYKSWWPSCKHNCEGLHDYIIQEHPSKQGRRIFIRSKYSKHVQTNSAATACMEESLAGAVIGVSSCFT